MGVKDYSGRRSVFVGVCLVGVALLSQCGQAPPAPTPRLAPLQPNRSSALAEAMREVDAELVQLRDAFLEEQADWAGAQLTAHDFNALMPTDSSMLVEGFQALAIAYQKRVLDFNAAPSADAYSAVVTGCVSCHQKACPGPLERIAKRVLP
jgi:hypothetical protein